MDTGGIIQQQALNLRKRLGTLNTELRQSNFSFHKLPSGICLLLYKSLVTISMAGVRGFMV